MPKPRRLAWSGVNSDGKGASNGVTSGAEDSLHKVSLHKNSQTGRPISVPCRPYGREGTDETLFGDLRVARGYRVRSATAPAAGRDQPAASSARAPSAAEVTLFRPQFAGG